MGRKAKPCKVTAALVLQDGTTSHMSTATVEDLLKWLYNEASSCERESVAVEDILSITIVRDG